MKKNIWFFVFLIFFIVIYFDAVKLHVGLTFRIAQLVILSLFSIVFLNDIIKKTINIPLLVFLFGFGVILTLISINSTYEKVDEYKFIIKYLTIFPASFYLGYKVFSYLNIKEFLKVIETSALVHCLLALLFSFYPISFLMRDRGPLTGYQGTFWESTGFGATVGFLFLLSLAIRYEYKIGFKNIFNGIAFYMFLLFSIIASKSKTFWTVLPFLAVYISLVKVFYYIRFYKAIDKFKFIIDIPKQIPKVLSIKSGLVILFIAFLGMVFFIVNSQLEESKKIVSQQMIQTKLEHERGKALKIALDLLEESSWLGGYGWGFVEVYFNTRNVDVLGLGGDVGMIFNSYLNEWLSVGILGLLFHIVLFLFAFSNRHLLTIIIPSYIFIWANIHPIAGGEIYYLFLGLSYGFKKYMENISSSN